MDKNFQIFILQTMAETYPNRTDEKFTFLMEHSKGDTEKEKIAYLAKHIKALEDFGYLQGFWKGEHEYNTFFSITTQGLVMAGIDILHPCMNQDAVDSIIKKVEKEKSLSSTQLAGLKRVLVTFPQKSLDRLLNKGLDTLLDLLLL